MLVDLQTQSGLSRTVRGLRHEVLVDERTQSALQTENKPEGGRGGREEQRVAGVLGQTGEQARYVGRVVRRPAAAQEAAQVASQRTAARGTDPRREHPGQEIEADFDEGHDDDGYEETEA